jgi:hypothetical protein
MSLKIGLSKNTIYSTPKKIELAKVSNENSKIMVPSGHQTWQDNAPIGGFVKWGYP